MVYVFGRFTLWFLLAVLLLLFGWVALILFKKFVRVLRELNTMEKKNEKDRADASYIDNE